MATYLQLANRVLHRINETELTATTGQVGVHAFVLDAINDVIRNVNSAEQEWPFNYTASTQTLTSGVSEYAFSSTVATVDWESFFLYASELLTNTDFTTSVTGWTDLSTGTGVASWVSTGNGRMNLIGGSGGIGKMTQAITTVTNSKYLIRIKTYSGTVQISIGTTSGGVEILGVTDLSITNLNRGEWQEVTFTATGVTTYITVLNAADLNVQIDSISCKEDFRAKKLIYIDHDTFLSRYKEDQVSLLSDAFSKPSMIYPTLNSSFGVMPVPDLEYVISFDSWEYPSDLSATTDAPNIPDRFTHVIINGVLQLVYLFKEDYEQATIMDRLFKKGLEEMRIQLIHKPQNMRGSNYGKQPSIGFRINRGI